MPLMFDMPFEQLLSYTGSSPKPDDFDVFWDDGLARLETVDPQVEVVPADFEAPFARCEHLYFTGTAGARVHAKLARPRDPGAPGPAVLMFHGYSGQSQEWTQMLPYTARGYTVAALDVRGQAGLSEDTGGVGGWTLSSHLTRGLEDGPEDLLFGHVFLDTKRLARLVMDLDEVDADRVGATGGSQGGALSLVCAALEPRVSLVASIYPFLSDYRRAWQLSLDTAPYNEITAWFRRRDPLHQRETEIFTRLGYIDVQHLAARVRARVDMTVALEDQVCPPSTQLAAYNKLTGEKSLRIYPDHGHEELPGVADHIYTVLGSM